MVIAAFNMLTNGDFYRDPGPDPTGHANLPKSGHEQSANSKPLDTASLWGPFTNTA